MTEPIDHAQRAREWAAVHNEHARASIDALLAIADELRLVLTATERTPQK